MRHVLVAGGSIAAVTAASALRAHGYDGAVTVLSAEHGAPYSRVPLSKTLLTGGDPASSGVLAALPADVELRAGAEASAVDPARRTVTLVGGEEVAWDGLVIATGARARRLARPGQAGELVVRDLADAHAIARRVAGARTAVVVGAGFLGMEVASTLTSHGLDVTVVDRDPPLRRLIGVALAELLVGAALERGVRFVLARAGVQLLGDPVAAVAHEAGVLTGDVVITAAGDVPNVEWLAGSGLPLAGGVVVDGACRVAPGVVAAGDVTTRWHDDGTFRRTPHWTSAVAQGTAAARSLLDPAAPPYRPDPYFWTEQSGLDVKIAGELPFSGAPRVLAGDLAARSALLAWDGVDGRVVGVASVNHRIPVVRLKRLVEAA